MVEKIRLGRATKQGQPLFSRTASAIVYKNTDKVLPPMPAKHPIPGASRQSSR